MAATADQAVERVFAGVVGILIGFTAGVLFVVFLVPSAVFNDDRHKDLRRQIICEQGLAGVWHGDVCIIDSRVVPIDLLGE